MTLLISGIAGLIGGLIGSYLQNKYGNIVILGYVVALVVLFIVSRFIK